MHYFVVTQLRWRSLNDCLGRQGWTGQGEVLGEEYDFIVGSSCIIIFKKSCNMIQNSWEGKVIDHGLDVWFSLCGGWGYFHHYAQPVYPETQIHEGRLQSSWTHFITPNWNFVEVR